MAGDQPLSSVRRLKRASTSRREMASSGCSRQSAKWRANSSRYSLSVPCGPFGIGGHEVLEGLLQDGHAARLGALPRRVLSAGRFDQHLPSHVARLHGRYLAVTAEDYTLVGRLPAAVTRAVVDDEGLEAGGLHPDAEPDQFVVPGDP